MVGTKRRANIGDFSGASRLVSTEIFAVWLSTTTLCIDSELWVQLSQKYFRGEPLPVAEPGRRTPNLDGGGADLVSREFAPFTGRPRGEYH